MEYLNESQKEELLKSMIIIMSDTENYNYLKLFLKSTMDKKMLIDLLVKSIEIINDQETDLIIAKYELKKKNKNQKNIEIL